MRIRSRTQISSYRRSFSSRFAFAPLAIFDAAAAAYEQASRVALAAGDMIGVLRGRIGDAKIAMARGNMPQAESILDETIERRAVERP